MQLSAICVKYANAEFSQSQSHLQIYRHSYVRTSPKDAMTLNFEILCHDMTITCI